MKQKNAFKNVKLGKNVYRQLKRRGVQDSHPSRRGTSRPPAKHRS